VIRLISVLSLILGVTANVFAVSDLEVVFDGCEPMEVISHDESCGNGPDPVNEACRENNGPVRWVPVDSIGSISTKSDFPGGLHNCRAHPNQGYYQCIVRGNVGDHVSYAVTHVSYDVTSPDKCILDPVIIIH